MRYFGRAPLELPSKDLGMVLFLFFSLATSQALIVPFILVAALARSLYDKFWERIKRPLLAVIKCIYLPPMYLHFMQDIEDRCQLLMSSTSFVDLPFQEHRMMEKYHMDQNPYISSLCPKPGVVSDKMTRGDDVAKSPGPTNPRWGWSAPLLGWPARVWCQ
jgi:hypothetical protein